MGRHAAAKMGIGKGKGTHSVLLRAIGPQLYVMCAKLEGLAHLLESQGQIEVIPNNMEEVSWGISLLLRDIAVEIREMAAKCD